MKRSFILAAVLSLAIPVGFALAGPAKAPAKAADAAKESMTKTVTGEVVDTGCYLAHGAKGEDHESCATKCISRGMPMGLLTADGTLYLLTLNHENADPYNQLKTLAAKTVSVTGDVYQRSGMQGIDVTAVRVVPAAAEKSK